jgi:hypothetical protein
VVLLQQASTTRSRSGMYKLGYPLHKKSRYNTQAGDVGARNCKIPTVNEDIIPPCMQAHVYYQSQDDYDIDFK